MSGVTPGASVHRRGEPSKMSEASGSVANRDQAKICVDRAREAFRGGDLDKAIRMLEKSMRLFPTAEAKELHAAILGRKERERAAAANNASSTMRQRHRQQHTSSGSTPQEQPAAPSRPFTPEQEALCQKLLRTKDYYARLDVSKTATEEEIKKAYKRRSLQVHPDKNSAPSAAEAFQRLSQAYECLASRESREHYDRFGDEDEGASMHRSHPRSQARYQGDDFMTPEDILNMFFNGDVHLRNARRRQQARYQRAHQPGINLAALLQFLPFVFLILFSLFSGPASEEKPFSLEPSSSYPFARSVPSSDVRYYVKRSFFQWYARDQRAMREIEDMVEVEYAKQLQKSCGDQQRKRSAAIQVAKQERDSSKLQKAEEMARPACEQLKQFYEKAQLRDLAGQSA